MTRVLSLSVSSVFALILTLSTCHATPAQGREALSEEDFLADAGLAHPTSAVLDEGLAIARADARRAATLENPEIFLEREAPGGGREQMTYALVWRPPLDGRRGARTAVAGAAVNATGARRITARAELRAELREIYATWALASEREALIAGQLDRLHSLVRGTSERARVGDESGLVARRFSLAAVELEALAATAKAELLESRMRALAWQGDLTRDVEPTRPELSDVQAPSDPDEHPAVAARRFEVEHAERELQLARRFLVFPEITVGWQDVSEPGFTSAGLSVGGSWPIPLFDRQQPERSAARARLAAAQARLELETVRNKARHEGARAAYAELRNAALEAGASLATIEVLIEAAAARFRAGESDATDLLETLRSVLSARLAALDLYGEALAAHRRLELTALRWSSQEGMEP